MAYYMYMGTMQIPIPPPTLETKINGKNKTIELLDVGEVNVLKPAGLTDISFECMLPNTRYPFNGSLLMGFQKASYYLRQLEFLKKNNTPFQFIVVRMKPNGEMLQMTNIKVTLEEYKIKEAAEEGFDVWAEITLKQWRDYGTKTVQIQTDATGKTTGTVQQTRSAGGKTIAATAKASKGSTLQRIVKKELGNTNNLFAIAALNKIAVPAALVVGQAIKLRQGV